MRSNSRSSYQLDLVVTMMLALTVGVVFRRLAGVGFFHDDWIFLGRAAGFLPDPDIPVRPLAFNFYWRMLHELAGHETVIYTASRFVLHFGAGLVLARIVRRLGADVLASWLTAGLFLVSPLAFEALYWASGVTDLLANLGLMLALLGVVQGRWSGVLWLVVGGLISLASKESGWWLPVASVVAWRLHSRRGYLWAAVLLAIVAGVTLIATSRGLSQDYTWSLSAVPWGLVRAGSWLVPRPGDLISVWDAGRSTQVLGTVVWLAWAAWAVLRWRRGDWLPAAALTCGILSLMPVMGLAGHMVPRYLLPVQACLATTLVLALPQRWPFRRAAIYLGIGVAAIYASWCTDQFLDRTYATGRPSHRLVAKERMVRMEWRYLDANGVGPGTGIVFLCRPDDDLEMREYMLDVIGRTWGPQVVLDSRAPIVIARQVAEIPFDTPVFQFGRWSLESLGVLRRESQYGAMSP